MKLNPRSPMRTPILLPLFVAGWVAGCGDDDPSGPVDAGARADAGNQADAGKQADAGVAPDPVLPRLVEAPCRYPIDPSQRVGETIHCADLFVASRRDGAPASEYRLHVIRFGPKTPRPDPLVILTGGPGQDLVYTALPLSVTGPFLTAERDFVQITQRGIGQVEPRPDCPELAELPVLRGARAEEVGAQEAAASRACRDRLMAAGVDLAAFSTRELAGDVEDLRATLGVSQIVVSGASYGSLWAQEIMRRYPGSVRAAVIESIVAPSLEWTLLGPRGLQTSLERLFAYCAADPACSTTFGEGYPLLQRAFATLEAEPLTLPSSGSVLGAIDLGNILYQAMYSEAYFGHVPLLLSLAAERDAETLEMVLAPIIEGTAIFRDSGSAQAISVWCSDSTQYYDAGAVDAAHAGVWPEASRTFRLVDDGLLALCAEWPSAPRESLVPVVSDIPTLVSNGEMDPATPATSAELVASTLSNSRYIPVPRLGHAGFTYACGLGPVFEFIKGLDPDALDLSCLDDVPPIQFVTRP